MEFINSINVIIENVELNGSLDFNGILNPDLSYIKNSDETNDYLAFYEAPILDRSISINNFIFNAMTNFERYNCINLYGKVQIENSKFNGNSKCLDSLLFYNGEDTSTISIKNSQFDGAYSNTCLTLIEAQENSLVKDCVLKNGGAYLNNG